MKGVTNDVISEVRSRASLVDVISESVVLKRAGKEFKGLCPFHKEKSPSFHVNPDKGIFKCFGCNEGGDVFAFVQKAKGVGFIDAVRDLAHKYGVALVESETERQEYDKKSAMRLLYEQAAEYYRRMLKDPHEGAAARKYLSDRDITEETIERFGLGFAPNSWDGLLEYLKQAAKLSAQALAEAGLVKERQGGSGFYDLFRNRLMIPICDDQGRVIAFGGRTMGDDQVKYLNSPETPIYQKGQHLFGFHLAKDSIKEKDAVIVAEGYFDAITPHQFGFTNTVATLGTALTEAQARLLIRYTESRRVFIAFDADSAGARAVERGVETLAGVAQGVGIKLRVLRVPGGKDPDECLRQENGKELFERAIEESPTLMDYAIEKAIGGVGLDTHTGRIEASRRVVPILGAIKNSVERGEYIRALSDRLRLSEEELYSEVRRYRRENKLDLDERMAQRRYENDYGSSGHRGGGDFNNKGYYRKGNFRNQQQDWKRGAPHRQTPEADLVRTPPAGRGAVPSGLMEAERQLLALYLTSRDDYDRVLPIFHDERLVTPEHQKIKEAIEGIGSQFNTMKDLEESLMVRVASEPPLMRTLTEILFRVEDMRKQDLPLNVVVIDYLSTILRERVSRLTRQMVQKLTTAGNDEEEVQIIKAIDELRKLEKVELLSARSIDDLGSLKNKISELETRLTQLT
ncbi:MAG: DNA primase [Candidatus Obscuribacterales bacterium]